MSRLIAFGCSNTYGQGLEDCFLDMSNPSKFSWPFVLGKMLNIEEVINCGVPGASNFEILNNILNFKFDETDIVVTMWTYCFRDIVLSPNKEFILRLHPSATDETTKTWMTIFNTYDMIIKSWVHLYHGNLHLDSLKIKNFNFVSDPRMFKSRSKLPIKNLFFEPRLLNFIKYGPALDNLHPNKIGHAVFASAIKEHILK